MKINFTGHSATERETDLTQEELVLLFEVMKDEFLTHIEFATFDGRSYTEGDKGIKQLCQNHQVDVFYKKDRLAFFQAIMDKLENPYK
jgi:hypothetical protein